MPQVLILDDVDLFRAKEEVEYLKQLINIHKRHDLKTIWKILKQIEEG